MQNWQRSQKFAQPLFSGGRACLWNDVKIVIFADKNDP